MLFYNLKFSRIDMKLTLDISLYPLNQKFKPTILDFIKRLERYENITIARNEISTQISGEYEDIMLLLNNEVKYVFKKQKSVFTIKILMGDKLITE